MALLKQIILNTRDSILKAFEQRPVNLLRLLRHDFKLTTELVPYLPGSFLVCLITSLLLPDLCGHPGV
jgi:hypothetical protein